jgi:hypothetical protein
MREMRRVEEEMRKRERLEAERKQRDAQQAETERLALEESERLVEFIDNLFWFLFLISILLMFCVFHIGVLPMWNTISVMEKYSMIIIVCLCVCAY